MPELPEVQTIVSDLDKKVVGLTIVGFGSVWKKSVRPSLAKFKKGIIGEKVVALRRVGKHIILDLDSGSSIVIHLKMTGHLLFKSKKLRSSASKFFGERVNGYVRHWFEFDDNSRLEFSDMRKFGWLALVKTSEVEKMKEISQLGIDALSVDLNFKRFDELLGLKPKSKIGILLLDQKWVAGIGNIYRSEILFEAGINPEKLVKDLKIGERKKIYQEMRRILRKAIKLRGTSDSDYRDTDGQKGSFQNFLKVYRKNGELCPNCEGKIKRFKLGQRSVFWCPKCQK